MSVARQIMVNCNQESQSDDPSGLNTIISDRPIVMIISDWSFCFLEAELWLHRWNKQSSNDILPHVKQPNIHIYQSRVKRGSEIPGHISEREYRHNCYNLSFSYSEEKQCKIRIIWLGFFSGKIPSKNVDVWVVFYVYIILSLFATFLMKCQLNK